MFVLQNLRALEREQKALKEQLIREQQYLIHSVRQLKNGIRFNPPSVGLQYRVRPSLSESSNASSESLSCTGSISSELGKKISLIEAELGGKIISFEAELSKKINSINAELGKNNLFYLLLWSFFRLDDVDIVGGGLSDADDQSSEDGICAIASNRLVIGSL